MYEEVKYKTSYYAVWRFFSRNNDRKKWLDRAVEFVGHKAEILDNHPKSGLIVTISHIEFVDLLGEVGLVAKYRKRVIYIFNLNHVRKI